jgi:hypothetical protein
MPVRLNTHLEKASTPARTAEASNVNPSLTTAVGVLRVDPINSRKHHGENGSDDTSELTLDDSAVEDADPDCGSDDDCEEQNSCKLC